MGEYSMCRGEGCQSKRECYRHIVTPSGWRPIVNFEKSIKGDKCPDFIEASRAK